MDRNIIDYEENIKSALQGLKRRETDIVALTEESIRSLPKPDNIRISMTTDISDPSVWIDEERVFKALVNLQTNAIEAMPDGGELAVSVQGGVDQVVIIIQDTGRGISRENMDKLFTPFFTTKPVGEGTGLGLPFAYGAVKLHSGNLTIESNADPASGPAGTRIQITLPRARPDLSKVILQDE
ncbi:MAG: HAMP domain-containing sensor histidine kinase [Desulfomonilia bacterium]|jgi:signal transduction histidine kinase